LQKWGDAYDISARIKQSMILYDEVILEAGTFRYSGSDRFVLSGYEPWSKSNTKDDVLRKMKEVEMRSEEGFITVIDGKTRVEKYRYKVEKKDEFLADYRTVDVLSEAESGSYGKETDFLKYAYIKRKENHKDTITQNTLKDLANKEFAETARKIYGEMPLVGLLNNLNDSLALSHSLKTPITVDTMHVPLLRSKANYEIGLGFAILDKLAQMFVPDFSMLDLDSLLQLRKNKAIEDFRKVIMKMNTQLQTENVTGIENLSKNIENFFKQELLDKIKELAPSRRNVP
jgi:hypothetical protein